MKISGEIIAFFLALMKTRFDFLRGCADYLILLTVFQEEYLNS